MRLVFLILSSFLFAIADTNTTISAQNTAQNALPEAPEEEFIIANTPNLKPTNIITVRAIGMGVSPQDSINQAQALALAKRAAIVDAYRQLGEKLHGIKITSKETIKDAMITSSIVRASVNSIIRGADIVETVYQDGLCQVEMEVKLDGRRWYYTLANAL